MADFDFYEFTGPDYNENGYCDAKYRASKQTVQLGKFTVPARLEALSWGKKEWQQHPVVFRNEDYLVIFLNEGHTTIHCSQWSHECHDLEKMAEELGLTAGSRNIASFIRQED